MIKIEDEFKSAAEQFELSGQMISAVPFGNGNINNTILVETIDNGEYKKYILQSINTDIFKNPKELMDNIVQVTSYLKKQICLEGGDPDRETLTPIRTKSGAWMYCDPQGKCWRMYLYITDAVCLEQSESAEQFYETGAAFGYFQYLLNAFPAEELYEVLPDFHNTPKRFQAFDYAVKHGNKERCNEASEEIAFCMQRKNNAGIIVEGLQTGILPLRVTHNDTKLSNIMLDRYSRKGICVIDLDTVMPGSVLYDYADAIRSGANTASEDETDLSKVSCSLELFEAFTRGFWEGSRGILTPEEVQLFVRAAWTITLEQAVRFLADYLMDDVYYRIRRPKHNLERTRNQLKLVADIEAKWEELEQIVSGVTSKEWYAVRDDE